MTFEDWYEQHVLPNREDWITYVIEKEIPEEHLPSQDFMVGSNAPDYEKFPSEVQSLNPWQIAYGFLSMTLRSMFKFDRSLKMEVYRVMTGGGEIYEFLFLDGKLIFQDGPQLN